MIFSLELPSKYSNMFAKKFKQQNNAYSHVFSIEYLIRTQLTCSAVMWVYSKLRIINECMPL